MSLALTSSRERTEDLPTASRWLWRLEWDEWLPRRLTDDGIDLHASDIDAALPFITAHYAALFDEDAPDHHRYFTEPFDDIKLRYLRTADVFEIKKSGATIGVLIAAPSDWSTYYIRTIAVLPEYQGRQIHAHVLPFLFEHLAQVGVRRIEAETSPSNLASVHLLTRLEFNVTGSVLTERWGALVRFTKFVDAGAEDSFLDKFCSGVRYQRRRRSGHRATLSK